MIIEKSSHGSSPCVFGRDGKPLTRQASGSPEMDEYISEDDLLIVEDQAEDTQMSLVAHDVNYFFSGILVLSFVLKGFLTL